MFDVLKEKGTGPVILEVLSPFFKDLLIIPHVTNCPRLRRNRVAERRATLRTVNSIQPNLFPPLLLPSESATSCSRGFLVQLAGDTPATSNSRGSADR